MSDIRYLRHGFDQEKLKTKYNIDFTRDNYEVGSFQMSQLIPTNRRNTYLLLTQFVGKWEPLQINFTIEYKKHGIEILDRRSVDWCYLGNNFWYRYRVR